jgi:heme-degrading monooxygenase HmoA
MKFNEMDRVVSLAEQIQSRADAGSVVLINKFTVDPAETGALVEAWAADAAFMKTQPGFISTQLHRGIAGSGVFVNYAIWESVDAFRRAFSQPEFQAGLARYPSTAVAEPHLFQKIAVSGICVA